MYLVANSRPADKRGRFEKRFLQLRSDTMIAALLEEPVAASAPKCRQASPVL